MSIKTMRLMRTAAFVYVGIALVVTLLTFTWLTLSPGELFPDRYADPSAANTFDKQMLLLWAWWVLIPGFVCAFIGGAIQSELNAAARQQQVDEWTAERAAKRAERRRKAEEREGPTLSAEEVAARLAGTKSSLHKYIDTHGINKDGKAVPRYANDERTHTIALRYNNLRSLA